MKSLVHQIYQCFFDAQVVEMPGKKKYVAVCLYVVNNRDWIRLVRDNKIRDS